MYAIYHYVGTEHSHVYELSSSEYVKKTPPGYLNMTKTHGIGSGIYGLTTAIHEHGKTLKETLTLETPVILNTNDKTQSFISLAQFMMETVEIFINKKGKLAFEEKKAEIPDFQNIADILAPDLTVKVVQAINNFIKDYKKASVGDFLRQPTNYLFEDGGYDGIYNSSPAGNSFAVGSIQFRHIKPRHQKYGFEPKIPGEIPGLLPEGNRHVGFQLGGSAPSKLKVAELRTMCNNLGMSCRDKDGKYLPKSTLIKLLRNA